MELSYQSTLEDVCEPQLRLFLRSKTFARQRLIHSLWGALFAPLAAYAVLQLFGEKDSATPIVAGAVAGPLIVWFTYADTVKKGIRKHLARTLGDRLPGTTRYSVDAGTLRCESLGAETAFKLRDLHAVSEDGQRLELSFGEIGLCVIPLRAFADESHKQQFLADIRQAVEASHPAP